MKRRAFLQRAGIALAAMGISEAGLLRFTRYSQALAQTSSRKLALLVGINQYPQLPALAGCVTDVELQRELLIYRFGFQAPDVLVLTDGQATRQNIETAFIEHLVKQAKPGDGVIFHFSGYGSQLVVTGETPIPQTPIPQTPIPQTPIPQTDTPIPQTDTPIPPTDTTQLPITNNPLPKIQNCLIGVDGLLSTKDTSGVNVLAQETLWLLLRSLQTDRIATILDTSFTDPSLKGFIPPLLGNLRMRSRPTLPGNQLDAKELAFQAELASQVKTNRIQKLLGTDKPGQLLAASDSNHVATEVQWNGFSAGLFTYALTQHLWQVTEATTVQISISRVSSSVKQVAGDQQQPSLTCPRGEQQTQTYHLLPDLNPGAEGAVIGVEDSGKTALLWLAGLPATILEFYGINSLLTVVSPPNSDTEKTLPTTLLQMRSREGLKAKARILSTDGDKLQPGQLVQESIRVLPRNIGLTVALDASLERIERVDATSAFANLSQVSSVIAGEQPADCLFGRVENTAVSSIPIPQYGLFNLGKQLIPNTRGEPGEAIKTAVYRLTLKLRTQLAAKLLRLSGNEASSRLAVKATLQRVDQGEQMLMHKVTRLASRTNTSNAVLSMGNNDTSILKIPRGSQIQYRLENESLHPVYVMLVGMDGGGSAIALYPQKKESFDLVILPGESITIPQISNPFKWIVSEPSGLAETHLIFSRAPFIQTLAAWDSMNHPRGDQRRIARLFNPLEVARAVLQDLHQASAVTTETLGISSDSWAIDVNAWATLSFVYEVVGNG
ncbi:caspase family protein [Microseira wollei]|uniref:Peptidase C14, caspase catalytic subunit p20 n=1 Tax=Microseira wollei NIES-4236 TaxID=2530354 RepID=A0AAV3X8G8_9CYAN|nr:caspase family protein [Microseira wollei]GET38463.1 peptidase C14, caspase catalytic subunit p20 [Microseira wollei NIES-4236]